MVKEKFVFFQNILIIFLNYKYFVKAQWNKDNNSNNVFPFNMLL